jgi:hypothetical protein
MTDRPSDEFLMARKAELLGSFRKTLREAGHDGTDPIETSVLMNALGDLLAMLIAATADDPETATRQVGHELLPALVAYFQEHPENNFWKRKTPN